MYLQWDGSHLLYNASMRDHTFHYIWLLCMIKCYLVKYIILIYSMALVVYAKASFTVEDRFTKQNSPLDKTRY